MPRFACPGCKKVISATDAQRGEVLVCPSCDKKIRVPASKTASLSLPQPLARTPKPATPPPLEDEVTVVDEPASPKTKSAKSPRRVPIEDDLPDDDADDGKPRKKKKKKRRKVSVTTGIFGTVGSLILLAGFFLILSGRWTDVIQKPLQAFLESQGIHPIIAIAVAAVVVLIPSSFLVLHWTKSSIVDAMPNDLDFRAAKLSAFKNLDTERLESLTETLEGLGFTQLIDYTVKADIDMGNKGFARLFVHEEEHVFAEVNQAFLYDDEPVPMRCSFQSFLEDDWAVSVTDRTPTKENYLMRRPQGVWRSLPDDDPDKLFEDLLRLRKRMMRDLEVAPLTDDSAKAYFAHEKGANRERKDVIRRRWALGIMIEFWFFERSPKYEWLGDYARHAGSAKKK